MGIAKNIRGVVRGGFALAALAIFVPLAYGSFTGALATSNRVWAPDPVVQKAVYEETYVQLCPRYAAASTLDRWLYADLRDLKWCDNYLGRLPKS